MRLSTFVGRKSAVAALCLCLGILLGCSKKSPSEPTVINTTPAVGSCPTPGGQGCPPLQDTRGVNLSVFANDNGAPIAWIYTFAGITVSGTGNNNTGFTGLTPGDLEVTGQIPVRGGVGFNISQSGSNLPGGIVPNSVQNLEGPATQVNCAGIQYFIPFGGT